MAAPERGTCVPLGASTKESSAIRNIVRACLFASAFCCFASTGLLAAETEEAVKAPSAAALQRLYANLQKAVQTRDYRVLQQDSAGEQLLRWQEGGAGPRDLPAGDAISLLRAAAGDAKLGLVDTPVDRSGLVTVGTEGWQGNYPFRYFQFKVVGNRSARWQWVGCYAAENRDRGGDSITEADEAGLLPGLLKDLKQALAGNDFGVLKRYVPAEPQYFYAPCGPGSREPRAWDYGEMTEMLLRGSGQGEITFNPYPDVNAWGSGDRTFVTIDTEGWAAEYPFLSFTFSSMRGDPRWRWEGVCYDVLPPLRDDSAGGREYFSRPQLPRPGPRRFSSDAALRARIAEIVEFGEWDALKAYAVTGMLIFGECSPEMLDADKALGKALPADQVVDSLKKRASAEHPLEETRMSHATFYETGGWQGKYPYVQFWFSEEKDGWQLSGVTYCRQKQFDLPRREEPFYKRMLQKFLP